MKKVLLGFFALTISAASFAQSGGTVCTPDNQYCGGSAGVYPLPDTSANPQPFYTVCAGDQVSFVFTAVVPDSLTVPLPLNLNTIEVNAMGVYTSGTTVDPLPFGLTYSCYSPQGTGTVDNNSSDCNYPDKSCGCLIVTGSIPAGTPAQDIQITILARINGALLVSFGENVTGTLHPLNGAYILRVEDCSSNGFLYDGKLEVKANHPNPFSGVTNIILESDIATELTMNVTNVLGQTIETRQVNVLPGANMVSFDGSNLGSGLYFYSFTDGKTVVTNKMSVQH